MSYNIDITRNAQKTLANLDRQTRRRIEFAIDNLANEPRPDGCRKLSGVSDTWRIRVGQYRVLYTIKDHHLLVTVIELGHRREVYR
ncbi:mRNA interferase RelE/StbE [Actinopolyspora alba]|uniref:mRNA interferase RelE/StbE n=1 Tax=Actinopolyspora alba TaxID=673379 RepID=A0A1I1W685_9ACTN|nr:type II toxin-antitoxin system RelE/ParE family toxin [Actinopolyspora alba]SFD90624.1 mRNA interferase RelE/StbE [Actinopolyspora alba]